MLKLIYSLAYRVMPKCCNYEEDTILLKIKSKSYYKLCPRAVTTQRYYLPNYVSRDFPVFSHYFHPKLLRRHPCISHIRNIHTSPQRRDPHPFVMVLFRSAIKLSVILMGRHNRNLRAAAAEAETGSDAAEAKIKAYKWMRLCVISSATLLLGMTWFYITHLFIDPLTKRVRFIAFSEDQIIEVARAEEKLLEAQFSPFFLEMSHPYVQRVSFVLWRILEGNKDLQRLQNRRWTLSVVDLPTLRNAFVLPSGNIFIFSGLLDLCKNDDQLGVILAHEISHAMLHHLAEQISNTFLIEVLFLIPVLVIWSIFPDITAAFVHLSAALLRDLLFYLPFNRALEAEADRVGLMMAARACFDIREIVVFWNVLMQVSEGADGMRRRFEWFSTHPSFKSREERLESLLPAAIQLRKEYNCPELSPVDPRKNIPVLVKELKERLIREKRKNT